MVKEKRKSRRGWLVLLLLLGVVGVAMGGAYVWMRDALQPMPLGEERYVRFEAPTRLPDALHRLEREGIVRDARATGLYARLRRNEPQVARGTYKLKPGMGPNTLLSALNRPVRQMVRLPETNWARRSANLLEKHGVTTADEYMALVHQPQEFAGIVEFPLPEETLEGYLYPDTYDLPPLLGAREVIVRQLKAFERKVWEPLGKPEDLHRLVVVGSMVELEVAKDEERPMVAGVIENRLRINMPLQIDATLLYGIQEWRRLTFADYREIDSPFNTYRHRGLPPGPICSPSLKSIEAAKNPAEHPYLYYVALPTGYHLFSRTYDEHRQNIQKRRAAIRALEQEKEKT
jgi:UPF0755 protein